jgi:TPP-dependent trihydroxycyclohexane-1,2-dione (THcHDO) dehydratase
LLIVGSGVRWASPFAELRELVDGMAMPFITSSVAGKWRVRIDGDIDAGGAFAGDRT